MRSLAYLLSRFSEPSSYAGLGAVLALLGWNLSDTMTGQLVQLLAAACGLFALFLKERGVIKAIGVVFAVLPALSGCVGVPAAALDGLGAAGSIYTAVDRITQATDPYIATACTEYQKGRAAADALTAADLVPDTVAARVAMIESFDAACANPPSGDPLSTAIWLGQLAGQLATLTGAAH
jgi:hypothetical protein